jgi:hypothetical protein
MMARFHSPAFQLLSDFGRAGGAIEEIDHEAQLKAAFEDGYRQGHADGRAEAEADAELLLVEAATRHAEDLAEQLRVWQRDCADILLQRLEGAERLIASSIEERVATLLRPWLIERLRERALQDLERAIYRSLSSGAKVHVEAPAEIIQHFREHLQSETLQIGFSESSGADVRAYIEDTYIEVNFSAWIAELEAAVP